MFVKFKVAAKVNGLFNNAAGVISNQDMRWGVPEANALL